MGVKGVTIEGARKSSRCYSQLGDSGYVEWVLVLKPGFGCVSDDGHVGRLA